MNRKIDQKKTKQVVIDSGLHQLLKIKAASEKTTIKTLLESYWRRKMHSEELMEFDKCPCDMCSSQDDENDPLERQKLDEICDVYSNYLIDYILENHKKDILKRTNKENTVK